MHHLGLIPSGGLAYYLLLGMVATVNPCGFAMLPAYLSYFLGIETGAGDHAGDHAGGAGPRGSGQDPALRSVRVALVVSAGFMAVFAVAGSAVRLASLPIYEYSPWISVVIGTGLVVLGTAMLSGYELVVSLPKLNRGGQDRTLGSMFAFGVSYAVASIGCTLPIFLTAVAGTMNRESFLTGVTVFAVYGLGMALVLSALTAGIALTRQSLVRRLRSARRHVNRIAGGLVLLAGAYVAFYGILELRTYRSQGGTIPSSGLTDRVTDWSYSIQDWLSETGAMRAAAVLALLTATAVAVNRFRNQRQSRSTQV